MVISWWVEICTSNLQDLHLRTAPTPGRTVGLSEEWDPRNYKVAPDSTKFNSQPNLRSKTRKRSGVLKKNNNAKIHQHLTSKTETENFLSNKNNYKTSRWTYMLGFPKKPRQKASQSFQPTTLEILSIHGALSSPWCSSSTVTLSPSFASRSPSSWTSSWRHFPQFLQISELEGELSTMVDRIPSVKGSSVVSHLMFLSSLKLTNFLTNKKQKESPDKSICNVEI